MRLLRQYARERLPARVVLPAGIVLAVAAQAGRTHEGGLSYDVAIAMLLFVQFRIWDDLVDRRSDAATHPNRVLVRSAIVAPFAIACGIFAFATAGGVLLRASHVRAPILLIALNAAAALWYTVRGRRTICRDHILLAKYPLFVLIISSAAAVSHPIRLLLSMTAVYLTANLYEAFHDRVSPMRRHRPLIACEVVLLVLTVAALSYGGHS
jgi:4-hydroxybenzoate polyprenyltransferase